MLSPASEPTRSREPKLLGVIDLKSGQAVHGRAGKRDSYQPHRETVDASPNILRMIQKYREQGVDGLYVADLNAISGAAPHTELLRQALPTDLPIWIDAGIRGQEDLADKRRCLPAENLRWVVASETCGALQTRTQPKWLATTPRLTVGLDLFHGAVRFAEGGAVPDQGLPDNRDVLDLMDCLLSVGIRSVLPLEIAAVGMQQGPATTGICRIIRERSPEIEIVSGGGVRDANDVAALQEAGCDWILVATALISGKLSIDNRRDHGLPTGKKLTSR